MALESGGRRHRSRGRCQHALCQCGRPGSRCLRWAGGPTPGWRRSADRAGVGSLRSAPPRYVWAAVAAQPVVSELSVHWAASRLAARAAGDAGASFWPLALVCTAAPPSRGRASGGPVGGAGACSRGADRGRASIEWLLLTTVAVDTIEDAIERVQWYACRWVSRCGIGC